MAHKEATKTYEESALLDQPGYQLVGGSMRRGNTLSVPREIQLPEAIEVPHPSNTSSPFIHDHYGTVLFKFLRKDEQYPNNSLNFLQSQIVAEQCLQHIHGRE